MSKTGLIVEGGGMKCAYSAGILDAFIDEDITFDYAIGVSAGSANVASFLAGQRERNLRRSDERHLEQSELTEETLCRRVVHKPKPVDDAVNDNIRMERLNRAIMELPEIQKRRFMLHFDLGLTYEQIGAMEGCTKMPIKRSIDRAIEKIRLALKNF